MRSQSNEAYWRAHVPSNVGNEDSQLSPFTRKNKYANPAAVGNNSLSADKDKMNNNVSNFFVASQKRQNHGSRQKA